MTSQEYKVVFVSDSDYKSLLLFKFDERPHPKRDLSSIFDNYKIDVSIDGKPYTLSMWNTAGNEDYDRLRPLAYQDANVIVIVISMISRSSFNNITEKWLGEVRHYCKDAAIAIVAIDLDQYQNGNPDHVSLEEIEKYANENKLHGYLACSLKTDENIDKVFPTIIQSLEKFREEKKFSCSIC